MATIPNLTLNDGTKIPVIGYGTGTAWYKKDPEAPLDQDLIQSMKTAIRLGYVHLDGAEGVLMLFDCEQSLPLLMQLAVYNTEPEVGVAVKECGVPREQLYVVTKVNQGVSDIPKAFEASLQKLGLDYVDLYLIHQPFFAKSDAELQKAWSGMEEIYKSGRSKSIGVSNYLPQHLSAVLKTATVPPSINQIEYHPYLQHVDSNLLAFHKEHNIATAAYGPLTSVSKARPGPTDEVFSRLAKKYEVTDAEVALRWCIDQGIVAVTTSSKETRMKQYLKTLDFKLTTEEIEEISKAGEKKHFRGFWPTKFDENDRS
ncbi:MAG: hypothetical protein M1837_001563 [Sclerophora amabilis]|nr:MAG: hypothetical protein M1837_001563 [Sclerophora amabilis]